MCLVSILARNEVQMQATCMHTKISDRNRQSLEEEEAR